MAGMFDRLGVRPVLNAAGTLTRLSGGPIRPEAVEAMAEAAALCVDMAELQAAASRRIAAVTGAEAGYVTPGASSALLLGAAAMIAGLSTARMARMPQTGDAPAEVVVARSHRNSYDVALRTAGARLVEVGLPDRVSGAGVRDAEPHEYADAIGPMTAGILFVAREGALPSLPEVAAVAQAAGVPVLVDAAAELPPAANLRRFVAEGADLVCFSGGKAIGGPPASGFLAGRADLVMSAALQHLDLDVVADLWRPPASLVDRARLAGPPRHGVGRACKIGKEQVAGFLAALDAFVAEGDAPRHARWRAAVEEIAGGLSGVCGRVELGACGDVEAVPKLALHLPGGAQAARALILALDEGRPRVAVEQGAYRAGTVVFNPVCLGPGEPWRVAEATRAAMAELAA